MTLPLFPRHHHDTPPVSNCSKPGCKATRRAMRSSSTRLLPLRPTPVFAAISGSPVRRRKAKAPPPLIAVDAPPPEKCREFVQIAGCSTPPACTCRACWRSISTPGCMLVTDLGTASYLGALTEAQQANDPRRARTLMRDALDALIRWQLSSREDVLPPFDEAFLRREMELMPEWFIGRHLGREVDDKTRGRARSHVRAADRERARAAASVHAARFHAAQSDGRAGPNPANPGVLDFQDAVYGPITYDVASLLRDAFLELGRGVRTGLLRVLLGAREKSRPAGRCRFRRVLPPARMDGSATAHQGAGAVLPDQLPRQQTALHEGSAAFHRLCAQGGRALCAAASVRAGCSTISKAARTKSATRSDHDDAPEESDDFRRGPRRTHASVDRRLPQAVARSGRQAADRLADRTARAGGLRRPL